MLEFNIRSVFMKAVMIKNFGLAETLETVEIDKPICNEDSILVKTEATGINPIDIKTRSGIGFVAEYIKDKLPWVLGYEFSGYIEELGSNVDKFKIGDKVYGISGFPYSGGCYAEYIIADKNQIFRAPENIDLSYAAGVPIAALTALQAINTANIRKNDNILIHAAAGGVGHFCLQLAKWKKANVIVTASERNHDFLYKLGADRCIDYTKLDFTKTLRPVDKVIDLVGGETGIRSLDVLIKTGVLITVPTVTSDDILAKAQNYDVIAKGLVVCPNRADLATITNLIEKEVLDVYINSIFHISNVTLAHKYVEQGHNRGKTIIKT
jgi:NADPH2:quinone reductase